MRINEISDKNVNLELNADELVLIGNIIYHYEKSTMQDESMAKPNDTFHELAAQIITARDLCQYGHLDNHSLSSILHHKTKSVKSGNNSLPVALTKDEKETLREYLEDDDMQAACTHDDFCEILTKIFGNDIPKSKLHKWMYPSEPE